MMSLQSGAWRTALVASLLLSIGNALPASILNVLEERQNSTDNHWVDTWTSMPQLVEQSNLPPSPFASGSCFKDATLRQTLHTSIGADRIRIQISNTFGGSALPITAASIALPTGGKAGVGGIDTTTLKALTFNGGAASVTIAKGDVIYTDPIDFTIGAQSMVTVTLYSQAGQSGTSITGHPGSRTTSFMQSGNHVNASTVTGASTAHWYFLTAIEAWAPSTAGAFVILGDSITDGRGSTDNANNRWPDYLITKLQAAGKTTIGVNNQAAGGNAVLSGGLGPTLLTRYKRDAIQQAGVKWVMIFEGVNDIGSSGGDDSQQLINAFTQIAKDCKAAGLKVFAATITPFGGNSYAGGSHETSRQKVNNWILTSGTFDATVDFAKLVANPSSPSALASSFDSGDHLHMNPAGYQAIANGFPIDIFT